MQFNVLPYNGTNAKAEYKCDVDYFRITYEVDPGPTQFPGSPGLRQSLKLNSKSLRRPTIKSLHPLRFLEIGHFAEACC